MVLNLHAATMVVPGSLRLGRLRLPVYGVFAAAGLVSALWLSQRTAKFVGIAAEKLWDAGMIALVAAFVASRALLVLMDFRAFLRYPVLVLALPSLTYGGMLLTGLLVWIYLRWKKMPVLDVLDAWAPCGALLAAVLSLGHFVEGTDAGMPTRLPWGVVTPGDSVLGRVHPVQLYGVVAGLALCGILYRMLVRRRHVGGVAGVALMAGGAISFLLDMLRQPFDSGGGGWLDPSQWVALAAMLAGAWVFGARKSEPLPSLSRLQVAELLENFVMDRGGDWDWEIIEEETFSDPLLLEVQTRFISLPADFPPDLNESGYCNEQGLIVLLDYARLLRARELRSDGEQSIRELE
jgi:phosphatidylglycerol:prolipoprotein diacylglycerol transferase